MRNLLALSLLLAAAMTSADPLAAQEWTRFRGPNGTGISDAKHIPAVWTEKDINWKKELPAAGHSSPVFWGDKIFLTGADDETTALRTVFCMDAKNGDVLWSRSYDSRKHKRHQFNSFASATPAVDKDHVYVCWSTPDEYSLIALDHAGEQVWYRNLGPYVSQHSCGASPVVYGDLVVLANDQDEEGGGVSFLIAVNRKTGETKWKIDRTSVRVAYSTPCVRTLNNGAEELIFNSQGHGITAVDPATGTINWEVNDLLNKRSVSSPVILDSGLITASCGSGAGGNYLVAVKPGEKGKPESGQMTFKFDKQAPYVPTPIAKGNLLFLWSDNGIVTCANSTTGETIWQKRVGGTFFGSPVCVNDKLYCISSAGDVVVVAASENYELLGQNSLNEKCHSTPSVSNGRMYVRTYRHLYSIGGEK